LRATTAGFLIWIALAVAGYGVLTYLSVRAMGVRIAIAAVTAILLALLIGPTHLDAKLWGVALMGTSTTILFALPWIDRSPVRSMRYRPLWHRGVLGLFVAAFFVLGVLGMMPPNPLRTVVSQICAGVYFGYFALMPWWSRMGTFLPVPDRVRFTAH
jgi:ubiquinol-cytochrome c reductase cytochrome b subunit